MVSKVKRCRFQVGRGCGWPAGRRIKRLLKTRLQQFLGGPGGGQFTEGRRGARREEVEMRNSDYFFNLLSWEGKREREKEKDWGEF